MPVTQRQSTAARFRRFERVVRKVSMRFARKFGLDFDELFADGCFHFVTACGGYHRRDGPFERYAASKVWNGLWNDRKREERRARGRRELNPRAADVEDRLRVYDESPAVEDVLAALSEDGKEVVYMALYPPIDVRFAAAERKGGRTPANWRRAITEHLRALGWGRNRANRAVMEVRAAFGGKR